MQWNVIFCMNTSNYFRDNQPTKTIATYNIVNQQCMKTKEEVLEYALCNNTEAFWDGYDDRR
jgi:hypothetical protein